MSPVNMMTARLVETARFVAIPIPSTIKGTITTPPPTPTSPESAPIKIPATKTRRSGTFSDSSNSWLLAERRGSGRRAGPPPAPEQVDRPGHERHRDRVVQVVQYGSDLLPVLSEDVTEVRQSEDPGYASEERVKGELGKVHPGGPRSEE